MGGTWTKARRSHHGTERTLAGQGNKLTQNASILTCSAKRHLGWCLFRTLFFTCLSQEMLRKKLINHPMNFPFPSWIFPSLANMISMFHHFPFISINFPVVNMINFPNRLGWLIYFPIDHPNDHRLLDETAFHHRSWDFPNRWWLIFPLVHIDPRSQWIHHIICGSPPAPLLVGHHHPYPRGQGTWPQR